MEVSSKPATIGSVRSPDTVADTPSTNCMNVGRNVNAPSMAKPTMNDSTQHTVNTGLRNSRIGRIGSAARLSTHTKAANVAAEPMNKPMISGEHHAGVVDDRAGGLAQRRDRRDCHEKNHHGHRNVDPEGPAPTEVVGQEAAEQRPDHRRHAEDGAEGALIAAAVAQGDDLTDQSSGGHH